MTPRKAGDRKSTIKNSGDAGGINTIPKVRADNNSIAIDGINIGGDVSGRITIGHTIGYTADQVSVLLKQITTTLQPKKFDGRCPYKGLDVFEEEDAELFFGRERLVTELVGRVKESRTVFITGPSGSGKSSLVRAGLIHALKQGGIKSSERWLYETMKPGREPLKDLALAFSRLKSPELEDYFLAHASETDILNKCAESVLSSRKDQRFVLFIDQFEEVFTQINSEDERVAFINMLAHAGTITNGRVIVLFSMRSDFVSNCATYPALNELLSQQFRQIGAMQPDELVSAIALPARHVGLPIEDELIARIINDMKGEPDALPLMQFALKDLFDAKQADGGVIALTLADYLKHGGIHKSLERHADATFAKLNESEQELTRSIFSGLIEIGRGTQDTKRTAMFDELIPANTKAEDVLIIVQKLADARLIITDEQAGKDTVAISHEKLIEAWPWLKKLVNENREAIALQNEIASDAKEWDDHNRDVSYLYSGVRLANVHEQLEAKKLVLSETSHEFVIAGQAQGQRNQRTRILGIAIPIGLVIVAVILFSYISSANSARLAEERLVAVNIQAALASTSEAVANTAQANAEEAQKQKNIARAGELATLALSQRDKQFDLFLLLSVEAFRSANIGRTKSLLLDSLQTHQQWFWSLRGQTKPISALAFSPKDKILASGSDDGTVLLWDWFNQQPVGHLLLDSDSPVESIAFNPDGSILAIGTAGSLTLWDVKSLQQIGQPMEASSSKLIFSPDGKTLAAPADYGVVTLWDVASHQSIGQLPPDEDSEERIWTAAFSPDGKTIVSGGCKMEPKSEYCTGKIILWDSTSLSPVAEIIEENVCVVTSIAVSSDGLTIAAGGYKRDTCSFADAVIVLWNASSLQMIGQPMDAGDGVSDRDLLAFSRDGQTLALVSHTGTVLIWMVESQEIIDEQHGELLSRARSVAFGGNLAVGGCKEDISTGVCNPAIILWSQYSFFPRWDHLDFDATGVAFSPNGKTLAWARDGSTISLWDRENFHRTQLDAGSDSAYQIVYSPNGKILASSGKDKVLLWDVQRQQIIGSLPKKDDEDISRIAFSPDGKTLVGGGCGKLDSNGVCTSGVILFWDVASRQAIGPPVNSDTGQTNSIAFSPDGELLASGQGNGTILLWDVASHQSLGQPIGTPIKDWLDGNNFGVLSVAFSPDGRILASGNDSGTINLWDVVSHEAIGQPLERYDGPILTVAISPDGKTLAAGSGGNSLSILLWDLESRQPIGQPLDVGGTVWGVFFSPDGKWLASASEAGPMIWSVDPQSWMERTCRRAARNLTRTEWAKYFPGEEYRATCSQFPLEPKVTATLSPAP